MEAIIRIDAVRPYDVFFNSNFEAGNLKQAFLVPQNEDFDEVTDEEAVIPDYFTDDEK